MLNAAFIEQLLKFVFTKISVQPFFSHGKEQLRDGFIGCVVSYANA